MRHLLRRLDDGGDVTVDGGADVTVWVGARVGDGDDDVLHGFGGSV
jgi:hypothetical protein